ncbi:MAG: hypothetical protein M0R34_01730 [Candidatus Marinimicrobia bacterium]|jgi:hypothetical protein|nr:hypothetical protein [Candidatus Neomarinimicrobiota bacterium]MCK9483068.1 hypothetical protein [Candidatus Neomarinimicrobiota bacterium]MCK9559245.1 hypothetical protein [Candidatus Neomarinimicrobiota bacterium]MDD5061258.1 hypothetical protein [Candidatus Neomarinimicrobiota bacterium]MDD5230886.1 hypothetical protein [Candidatus Neomarinimicrobiota bacterium]
MRKILTISLLVSILILSGLSLIGCDGDETGQVSYATDIDQKIFRSARYNCIGCHTSALSPHLDLTTYDGLMAGSDNGPVVEPGNADNSFMYEKISQETPSRGIRMPQGGPYLNSVEIKMIEDWINQGAKDN